ncbi:MAG: nucleotidyltransferase substrate binding protein [bacterium]
MQSIRWIQRLENFKKAFKQFEDAVFLFQKRELSDLEKQGLIQSFEYTFELAWNLIRDYFIYQGVTDIKGSRDAFKTALKYNLIDFTYL